MERDIYGNVLSSGKLCLPCPTGTISDAANPYLCKTCPDINMSWSNAGLCVCNSGYIAVGVNGVSSLGCVPSTQYGIIQNQWPSIAASSINYDNVQTAVGGSLSSVTGVTSVLFQAYYTYAAVHCFNYQSPADLRACNSLASLCALTIYDQTATAVTIIHIYVKHVYL